MKKIIFALIVCASAILASAQDVDRTGAMNRSDRSCNLKSGDPETVVRLAEREPGFKMMVEQTIETNLVPGDLEIVQRFTPDKGCEYLNSGLAKRGTPVNHWTVAKGTEVFYVLRSRTTLKTVQIKEDCLNPVQSRVKSVPMLKHPAETTWDMAEVNVDVTIDIDVTATATASTAPISIIINNAGPGSPLMVQGPSPFMFVRDSRGLMSLGYQVGDSVRICNTNNNSNSNSNSNTTVVNTGSGNASGSSNSGSTSQAGGD